MSRDIPLIRQNSEKVPCKKISINHRVEIRLKEDGIIVGSDRLGRERCGGANNNDAIGCDVVLNSNRTTRLSDVVINADI